MTKINDLRSYMEALDNKNELEIIHKQVDKDKEIGPLIATAEKKDRGALLFKNINNYKTRVIGGVLASQKRIAIALECEPNEVKNKVAEALKNPIKPEITSKAPVQEVVIEESDINLFDIPIPVHAPKDGGPFITAGVTVSKDPNSNRHNLSYQRMQIKDKNKMGIMINEWRHLKGFLDKAELLNEPLPIAVVVGPDPTIMISAGFRYDGDETQLAGSLRGKPIQITKCITSEIKVPANAEYVIEGVIVPGLREKEGPLAEFTGHYGKLWESPVVEVKAITHRHNPIWQTLNGASYEHINLGNVLPREPLLYEKVSYVSDNIINVHIPPYGSGFLAVVSINKGNPGEPKNVALAAMTAYVNIKNVIIVDGDVDIYNSADLMWALSNRVDAKNDIFYIHGAQGHELDPVSNDRGIQTKMGIDATLSEINNDLERVVYPEIDIDKYI